MITVHSSVFALLSMGMLCLGASCVMGWLDIVIDKKISWQCILMLLFGLSATAIAIIVAVCFPT